MLKKRSGRLGAIIDKVEGSRLVKAVAESRVVKRISQSNVVRRAIRILRAARYPSRDEIWLVIRICIVGILIIGGVAFLIRLILTNGFLPIIGLSPS